MKVLIINGSPKGKNSTTLYTSLFLEKRFTEHQYAPPQNFLGVGGMKIFRDLIYEMRGLMRADHRFFKSHGQYDFQQKRWKRSWAMYLVGGLMGSPRLRAKMGPQMTEGMIGPYRKMLNNL